MKISKEALITIVIPCKNDPLIIECVKSIDYPCEVLIVFNGASITFIENIKNKLSTYNVRYEVLKEANLSWALETGTRIAESDYVLYMDSDCTFGPGAIKAFSNAIEKGKPLMEVYKGDVIFAKGISYIEKIIAQSRTHHTAEVLTAYKPPLLISKNIINKIGGYAFDKRLIWREDSDLDHRIRMAKISIVPVKAGVIFHKSINLKTDMRSTFRYGIGLAIANVLNITLTEVPRSVMSTYKSQGIIPALYMLIRNRVYDCGYWYTRIRIALGFLKLSSHPQ